VGLFLFFYREMNIPWLKKYFGRLYLAVLWSLVVLILLALPGQMLPNEPTFSIPNLDKFVHICLFGGFVVLWCLYTSTKLHSTQKRLRVFFFIFIVAVTFGITMEYVQKYFIPFRDFSLGDIIADMIGAGLAYGLCNTLLVVENNAR
jgi:VanZ family protein